jgi:hypothetical protein
VKVNGNIGVGGTGAVQFGGPGTINGNVEFAAANTGQFQNNNGSNVGPTGITYNNMPHDVAGDLTSLNSRSAALGAEAGTALTINGAQTVNGSAAASTIDANGNEVFTVNSFSDNNGDVLKINGDGHDIVFNFASNTNFQGAVVLTGGLTPDQVLFNFTGSGKAASINTNASSFPALSWQGIILDPNGTIQATNANIKGRLFGGDSNDMQIVSGTTLTSPTPEPTFLGVLLVGVLGLIGVHVVRNGRPDALRS